MFITRKKYEEDLKRAKEEVYNQTARMNKEKALYERLECMEAKIEELRYRISSLQEGSHDNR